MATLKYHQLVYFAAYGQDGNGLQFAKIEAKFLKFFPLVWFAFFYLKKIIVKCSFDV